MNQKPVYLPLAGMFILALFYTAYFTRDVLLPIILALFLTFLLRPFVRVLKKIKIPEMASAGLILLSFLAVLGFGAVSLSDPAREWMDKAPQTFEQIGREIKGFITPVQKAKKTAEALKNMTGEGDEKRPPAPAPGPSLGALVFNEVQNFLAKGAMTLILLFFLLASGDLFVIKLMRLFPQHQKREKVKEIVNDVERSVSRYLLTVTLINAGEGVLVGLALHLIGMPDPVLWGTMAALLIYIPYLGPLVGISVVTIVAFVTMESAEKAFLAPLIYLSLEIIQAQLVTPMVLGARFAMNPVTIFVWLIFWGWLWGIVGALIAVPMLTIFKIFCDHIEPLKPVGEFLSD